MVIRDPFLLTDKPDELVFEKYLQRMESVRVLLDSFHGNKDKEKLTLFLENGIVYKLADTDVLKKTWKDLEYLYFGSEE